MSALWLIRIIKIEIRPYTAAGLFRRTVDGTGWSSGPFHEHKTIKVIYVVTIWKGFIIMKCAYPGGGWIK